MARKSTKENKTIYQRTREGLGLTREEASELLVTMSPERIEKIESERSMPHPDEVLLMSDQYPDRSGLSRSDRLFCFCRRYRTVGPCDYDCNRSRHPEGLLLNTLP